MRIRRRNLAWLTILGVMMILMMIAQPVNIQLLAVLGSLFIFAAAASLIEFKSPIALGSNLNSNTALTRMRMSTEAREAADRARRRGSYITGDLTLIDIGLISSHSSPEGMVMQKSRTISGDDDGVRPFITLHVPPHEADRHGTIRFEIIDHNGNQQYIHEMRTYLRDGEMNILADHHLPLLSNESIGNGGEWDLHVHLDGTQAGVLSFNVTPSLQQRREKLVARQAETTKPADEPLRLEELLKDPQQNQGRR